MGRWCLPGSAAYAGSAKLSASLASRRATVNESVGARCGGVRNRIGARQRTAGQVVGSRQRNVELRFTGTSPTPRRGRENHLPLCQTCPRPACIDQMTGARALAAASGGPTTVRLESVAAPQVPTPGAFPVLGHVLVGW